MSATSNLATCAVCGAQFDHRKKAGEVSIRLQSKAGISVALSGPVCPPCIAQSATSPEAGLEQMRRARGRLLLGGAP